MLIIWHFGKIIKECNWKYFWASLSYLFIHTNYDILINDCSYKVTIRKYMIIINADLEKSSFMWHLPWQRNLKKLNLKNIHKYGTTSWLTLCIEPTFQIVGTISIRGQTRRNTAVSICDHRIVILYVYAKLNQQIFHAYEIARCKTNISLILPSQEINFRLYKC